jgi:hypothetical protein
LSELLSHLSQQLKKGQGNNLHIYSPLPLFTLHVSHFDPFFQFFSFMSLLNAVQFIGFSLTPLLGSLLCQLDFQVFGVLTVNCFSAPGFFLALVNAVILVLFVLFFQEPPSSSKSFSCSGGKERETKEREKKQLLSGEEERELISSEGELKWAWVGPAIFISLNLVVRGCLAVLETIGGILFRQVWISGPTGGKQHPLLTIPFSTLSSVPSLPLSASSFSASLSPSLLYFAEDSSSGGVDDTKMTGYYFTCVGGVGLVTYFAMTQVSKRVSDFTLLVLGLFCLSLGSLLLIGVRDCSDFPRFLIGCICVWSLGMPLTATCVLSMCSKVDLCSFISFFLLLLHFPSLTWFPLRSQLQLNKQQSWD